VFVRPSHRGRSAEYYRPSDNEQDLLRFTANAVAATLGLPPMNGRKLARPERTERPQTAIPTCISHPTVVKEGVCRDRSLGH
jgi:hypothetical protein